MVVRADASKIAGLECVARPPYRQACWRPERPSEANAMKGVVRRVRTVVRVLVAIVKINGITVEYRHQASVAKVMDPAVMVFCVAGGQFAFVHYIVADVDYIVSPPI